MLEIAGDWCLGLAVVSIIFRICVVAAEPLLERLMEYEGPYERYVAMFEDSLSTFSVMLFLSVPVALVFGCTLLGRWLWSFA